VLDRLASHLEREETLAGERLRDLLDGILADEIATLPPGAAPVIPPPRSGSRWCEAV
jgi:hypothetical protein